MGNSSNGMGSVRAPILTYYTPDAWIDGHAEQQLQHVATWQGMRQVAAFPDLHPGRHGPVGAAFLSDRLHPQLVGSDIGCGMAIFALDLPAHKLKLARAARRLERLEGPDDDATNALQAADLPTHLAPGLGTIGGGNHFSELQTVSGTTGTSNPLPNGSLCLMVHSGSRALGQAIWMRHVDRLAENGLGPGDPAARAYLAAHDQAVRFAALNRARIAARAAQALGCDLRLVTDVPHNLVVPHQGAWLHRKGAAAADHPTVPLAGSRDSHSYLLQPLGTNPLQSLAHGAGRRHDRASMHHRIPKSPDALRAMERNRYGGMILCQDRAMLIEEAPKAYKDAARVVADLQHFGLAAPIATLTPLLTYKLTKRGQS